MASVFDFSWTLPQQFQRPVQRRAPARMAADYPADLIDAWKKIAMQCPHTRPRQIKRWLQSQPAFLGAPIDQVMAKTGVLQRKMPGDFIDAVFENNTPARQVLVDLLSRFADSETLELHAEEHALVIKSHGATTLVRPAQDGVFLAISLHSINDRGNRGKTLIHHVQIGKPLPNDVLVTLEFDRLQI
jgi:hypothetical protein